MPLMRVDRGPLLILPAPKEKGIQAHFPGSPRQPAGGIRRFGAAAAASASTTSPVTGCLHRWQHRHRQHHRRLGPARPRVAHPDPWLSVRHRRRGPWCGPGRAGRDPGNPARPVPAGRGCGQQPDLGTAHHRGRRAGARRPAGVLQRDQAGQRRGLPVRPGVRGELRSRRRYLHRLTAAFHSRSGEEKDAAGPLLPQARPVGAGPGKADPWLTGSAG